jgi:galactonate dehydratase
VPNFLCQEQVSLGDGYLKEPFKIVDGYVPLPTKPGLGIELDDAAIEDKVFPGDWDTPMLRHPDGSVADW